MGNHRMGPLTGLGDHIYQDGQGNIVIPSETAEEVVKPSPSPLDDPELRLTVIHGLEANLSVARDSLRSIMADVTIKDEELELLTAIWVGLRRMLDKVDKLRQGVLIK